MTEQKKLARNRDDETGRLGILEDETLSIMVSAYLDAELDGEQLDAFERILKSDATLAREVQDMRNIEKRLIELGSSVLSEPLPDSFIKALSKFENK